MKDIKTAMKKLNKAAGGTGRVRAYLEDDGTLDTVISVHGKKGSRTFRFMPEGRRNVCNLMREAKEAYHEED